MITPVILAGGSGTRLWPLSRKLNPKQFLKIFGNFTMFQQTLKRLHGLSLEKYIVVCSEEHRFLAGEQLSEIGIKDFSLILEPMSKNTAPAIALAAFHSLAEWSKRGEEAIDPVLLVLPADHVVKDESAFRSAVIKAMPVVQEGKLIAFGIVPTSPETGYGYIEFDRNDENEKYAYNVLSFKEKPSLDDAKKFLQTGRFYWNGGIFMFKAQSYLNALRKHAKEIYEFCEKSMKKTSTGMEFIRVDASAFEQTPSMSIDYAVMEKTDIASVVPLDAGWSDIGSWTSLWEASERDVDGNALLGDVKIVDAKNSLVRAESRLVAAVGVQDLVVVETRDAVLVAHKEHVQEIKSLVENIRQSGRQECLNQREVFRPWGSYDSLERGERFQVKRIKVKPGAKTSLQMHHHRAEHWIVVKGTARVTIDEKTMLLAENESVYIPMGKPHRLENPGKIFLELVEVQSGGYLEEDDIVRIEDSYGRM